MICKIVGFSILRSKTESQIKIFHDEHSSILKNFPWLKYKTYYLPELILTVWGHGDIDALVYSQKDEHRYVFLTNVNLSDISEIELRKNLSKDISCKPDFPWEGIANLVIIDANIASITNDWTGANKIFSGLDRDVSCISSLESVVYKTLGCTDANIDHVAVYALMATGAYFGNQTLYKNIRVQAPDSTTIYYSKKEEIHQRLSIFPTQDRWTSGWQELVEEWGDLVDEEMTAALGDKRKMVLLLSGGIDSRVIAAIASEKNYPITAISYGNSTWQDGIQAKQIAKNLHIPFKLSSIGLDYLKRYTKAWIDWFGASMCLHGVYQMPGLCYLRENFQNHEIITGFTGDPLEGMQIESLMADCGGSLLEKFFQKNHLWMDDEIQALIPWLNVKECRAKLEMVLINQYKSFQGADYQRMWLLFQWNRVFQFSSYQPMMYEYFSGVVTPFVRRSLANFTLSLPRAVLERRRLFYDVIKSKYPAVSKIPGTYDQPTHIFDFIPTKFGIPLLLTKGYMLKAAIGYLLPNFLRIGIFREFSPTPNLFAQKAIHMYGAESLYPLNDINIDLQNYFDKIEYKKYINCVLKEPLDIKPSMKAWPLQTLVNRLVFKK